jgi:hypothetical protein
MQSDPQLHEESVRYLRYGCVFRLVDVMDKRYQTFQDDPDTYPTVWVRMCARKCVTVMTSLNDYLTNTHKLEKKMGHVKKAALSTHQEQFQKQETQVNKDDMTPNRYL